MGFFDLLFPVTCLECKKGNKYLCNSCLQKVPLLKNFSEETQTFSIYKYQGVIRKAIIKLKYNFASDIAKELSEISAQKIKSLYTLYNIQNTILVPIPLHSKRERWRGFNQSAILGKLIAEKMNWQFKDDLLIRPQAGQNQVGLAKSERVRNIRGKFAVNSEAKIHQNNTYIVFDDVATTGSTIKEAIKVLKKACPERNRRIFGLTIAA